MATFICSEETQKRGTWHQFWNRCSQKPKLITVWVCKNNGEFFTNKLLLILHYWTHNIHECVRDDQSEHWNHVSQLKSSAWNKKLEKAFSFPLLSFPSLQVSKLHSHTKFSNFIWRIQNMKSRKSKCRI